MKRVCASMLLLLALPGCRARTVTDEMGRAVDLPEHPHRLVCLMPSIVDDVYALGAGADVVGVTDYVEFPVEAKSKPSVGLPLTPSVEAIVALHPDLILGDPELSGMETMDRLRKLGFPVFAVVPHGIEGIYRSLASLGRALNREDSARALIAKLHAREAAVRQRVSGKPVVTVLMPVGIDPVVTIGKHAFITEMIAIAGGRSVTDDLAQEWQQISLEAVMARNPQGLLLVRGSKMSFDEIQSRPGWSNLAAIRNKRIYTVDDRIVFPSPVAFDALEELARQFHP
jgi:iron complex transport system substrate-binding protein